MNTKSGIFTCGSTTNENTFCFWCSFGEIKTNLTLKKSNILYIFILRAPDRIRSDLEKSWKITLGLENSWNFKKCNLSLNCPGILKIKISLIITKSPWKYRYRNSFLDAVHNKNQENFEIGNRKQSGVSYSAEVLPWYSIQVHVVWIECNWKWNFAKRKSGKAKMKVVCGDNTQSWNQAETLSSKGKCVYNPKWERNPAHNQY